MDIRYLRRYEVVCDDNPYPKEACDVRTQHSTVFPLSSNQNFKPGGRSTGSERAYPRATRQTISTHLPWVWSQGYRGPQLDPAHHPGSEHHHCSVVGDLPIPQGVLLEVPWRSCRGLGTVSSLSASDHAIGPLCLSVVPNDDRLRCRRSFGLELENGKSH
jgi:hypothetical protein